MTLYGTYDLYWITFSTKRKAHATQVLTMFHDFSDIIKKQTNSH